MDGNFINTYVATPTTGNREIKFLELNPKIFKNNLPLGFENLKMNWINILEAFLKSNKDYLLFLEDDAEITSKFIDKYNSFEIPNNSIITLFTHKLIHYKRYGEKGLFELKNRTKFTCSVGLIINKKIAIYILETTNFRTDKRHLDILIRKLPFEFYYYSPNIIQHNSNRCLWRESQITIKAKSLCFIK
jgi:GR25 family glycosyltransferase involved in LPS biosynthesis